MTSTHVADADEVPQYIEGLSRGSRWCRLVVADETAFSIAWNFFLPGG